MFPHIVLKLFGYGIYGSTSDFLMSMSVLFALMVTPVALHKEISFLKSVAIVFLVSLSAFIGARLFHVVWERPEHFINNPGEIFTRFDGMTFYGAFFAGLATFALLLRRRPLSTQEKAWDVGAIICAFLLGVLRVSCFAVGCCWGSPTAVPWAVRYYDSSSAMPWLGIPVHPVQLYESASAFIIAALLLFLKIKKPKSSGLLIYIFCIFYSLVRFELEKFRGDSFRGVDLVAGLSTSQLLSILIGLISAGVLVYKLRHQLHERKILNSLAGSEV